MARFWPVPEPSILRPAMRSSAKLATPPASSSLGSSAPQPIGAPPPRLPCTAAIGAECMVPWRAIIAACVALRIRPNTLTLIGVIVNVGGAWALGYQRFILAGVIMIVANIFDFIDGKVAYQLQLQS